MDFHAGEANQAVHLVIAEGLEAYLPLADMVDIGKEVERLKKQATKLQADFDSSMKRLSSSKVSQHYHTHPPFIQPCSFTSKKFRWGNSMQTSRWMCYG